MSRYISTGGPRLLVGFESSGVMRRAFRALGIDAYSCDLLPSKDDSPFHIQCDVFEILDDGWDGGIFHPSCTFLTCAAEWAYNDPDFKRYPNVGYHQKVKPGTLTGAARREAREQAILDVKRLLACRIPLKGVENPRGVLSSRIRKPNQTVQPYDFGDDASKATCLWLEDFPELEAPRIFAAPAEWSSGTGSVSSGGATRPTAARTTSRLVTTAGRSEARRIPASRTSAQRRGHPSSRRSHV